MKKTGSVIFIFIIFISFVIISMLFYTFIVFRSDMSPSYKNINLADDFIKICRNEYKLDIEIQENRGTIYINSAVKNVLNMDGTYSADSLNTIKTIMKAFSRIMLSADKRPEFYVLTLNDTESSLRMTGAVEDIIRYQSGSISPEDYSKRRIEEINPVNKDIKNINYNDFAEMLLHHHINKTFNHPKIKKYFQLNYLKIHTNENEFLIDFDINALKAVEPYFIINQLSRLTYEIVIKNYSLEKINIVKFTDIKTEYEKKYSTEELKELYESENV